ncbi:MAG: hypothetical protein NZ519_05815 [Bacteroidia bacterium]|nr:hypothetical protein [Bacteroidia bacterium]
MPVALISFMVYFNTFGQKVLVVFPESEKNYFSSLARTDTLMWSKKVKEILAQRQNEGFLEYSIDSTFVRNDTVFFYIWTGKKYVFLPLQYRAELGKNFSSYLKSTSNPKLIQANLEKLIALHTQKGYPFAKCKVEYQLLSSKEAYVYQPIVEIEKGSKHVFDTVLCIGVSNNASRLAQKIIDIHSKDVFNQKKIDNSVQLLNNSPYFEQSKIKEIRFTAQNTVHLKLETQVKKASYIDGILGIAPANAQQGKTQITGNLKLNMVNPNWGGKILYIQWDKLASTSQNLEVSFKQPYLFYTPFDIQTYLSIQKQDSTFLRRDIQAKTSYRLSAFWSLQGGVHNRHSYSTLKNNFKRDTLAAPILPKTQNLLFNFSQTLYNVGIKYFSLNDLYAPQRGTDMSIEIYAGYKNIRQTQGIDKEIFDKINKRSLVYTMQAKCWQYKYLNKRQVGVLGLNTAILINPYLTFNDLHRLGGLRTIRGFNELSYFATNYAIATVEYRYFLESLSFVSIFLDYAWLQERYQVATLRTREIIFNSQIKYQTYQAIEEKNKWNNPIGFGLGMQLWIEKAGLLSLAMALGKDTKMPTTSLNFRQLKLHFGLLTRF